MSASGTRISPGQCWRSKSGGFVVEITGKATGNKHWHAKRGRHSHTIHEGTLAKFYELVIVHTPLDTCASGC
jgi:hypothetical protein